MYTEVQMTVHAPMLHNCSHCTLTSSGQSFFPSEVVLKNTSSGQY